MKRLLVVAALVAALLAGGCKDGARRAKEETVRSLVTGVVVTEIKPVEVREYYETVATLKAGNASLVAAKIMGAVTSVLVREGEAVKAGQVLMTLDDRHVAQKVAAAEAGYQEARQGLEVTKRNRDLARTTYGRYVKLLEGRAVSQQEFDQVENQKNLAELEYQRMIEVVNRARAGLDEARVYLGYGTVKSPVGGLVADKRIEVGSMAAPGMVLLTVQDVSRLELAAHVAEKYVARLAEGLAVTAFIPALDRQITGRISEISPAIDPASRAFLVKVELAATDLNPGLHVKLKIPVGSRRIIALPPEVLVHKGQLTGVYVVNDSNIVSYRLVRTGRHYGDRVEILAGLKEKDRVVTENLENAIDGGILQEG